MKIIKSFTPSILFLNLVSDVKFLFDKAFTLLGLLEPPPPIQEDYHPGDGYIFLTSSRSGLMPVPIQVLMAMIKKNLPVIEYGDFIERLEDHEDEQVKNGDDDRVCRVCLESMERSDEMRELCMCSHVFHKDCIDSWVNEGRVTCPLCRSTLYPETMDWSRSDINLFVQH
ncbi:Subtilase family protein, putative isoform 1 [Hibiscus syriacus]|uniref:Subtilase family protein, putative isoform 1 n=1 Tax=Hibiscus syriacus TaxID=106335 RepID=A0A6A2XJE6_HIBSY|nr:E3 ubiquitin-protein ligase RHA1B-like [Hibiscus syriacus]KAE8658589.1 Subtilase family protein, putative isoform 1 [Hibiscus syriacus]